MLVWIDRITTQTQAGPETSELHPRLTVIASTDAVRRRTVYNRIINALRSAPSTTLELRTEYGDNITAQRGEQGQSALYDTNNKLPIHSKERSLGIVAQLNDPHEMASHMDLFHATSQSLRARAQADAELIRLARTPLNKLFELATKITAGEAALNETQSRRSDLTASIQERNEREESISSLLEEQSEGERTTNLLTYVSFAVVLAGIAAAVMGLITVGGVLCMIGLIVAAVGHRQSKQVQGGVEAEALEIQLGRVGELFDTHDLTRSRRAAEESLGESRNEWRSIAGTARPSALLTDRPQIEELASHLRLIENENVEKGDTSLLVGFASLLAELNRRFPAERVPLLVDDLYPEIPQQYHGAMCELLLRASHRRQVVCETADLTVAKWAAVEAVGGDAMLVTDHEIDVEPIINQAVAAQTNDTV